MHFLAYSWKILVSVLQEKYSLKESCKISIIRNNHARSPFFARILQEYARKFIELQESYEDCIILQDSCKKYVFGRILQDSCKKCIFSQPGLQEQSIYYAEDLAINILSGRPDREEFKFDF